MELSYATEGNLIFIQEGIKRRPYICVKVYRNKAGIPYNWLVLPITSSTAVGFENLFQIEHPKLNKKSYIKLNNIQTIEKGTFKAGFKIVNFSYIELEKILKL